MVYIKQWAFVFNNMQTNIWNILCNIKNVTQKIPVLKQEVELQWRISLLEEYGWLHIMTGLCTPYTFLLNKFINTSYNKKRKYS
jgi:hypothetical protein